MDEIVVRLKSGEEIIYPHPAAVDIYNANEVVFVIHREKEAPKVEEEPKK